MSMTDLEEAFNLFEANIEKCDFEKEPKSEELIQLAEKTLGLKFPPTYRLFLKRYGCGGLGGTEIYGIIHDNFEKSGAPDAVWLTLTRRRKWNLPANFIAIASLGEGSQYYLDASQRSENEEYPVVICWNDLPENKEIIAEDFGEFLLEQTKTSLDVFNECHSNEYRI